MEPDIYLCIAVMAGVTYAIRVLPLTLIRGQMGSRFLRSFLYYVPYVTLAVMVFPSMLYATESFYSGLAALLLAGLLALRGFGLLPVAAGACALVFLLELWIV